MSGDALKQNLYDYIEESIMEKVDADIAAGTATYYSDKNQTVYAVVRTPEEAAMLKKECDELLKRIDKQKTRLHSYFSPEEYELFVAKVKMNCKSRRRFRD